MTDTALCAVPVLGHVTRNRNGYTYSIRHKPCVACACPVSHDVLVVSGDLGGFAAGLG